MSLRIHHSRGQCSNPNVRLRVRGTPEPIVFLAALSRTIGIGHASRVQTLARECQDREQPAVVVLKDPDNLSDRLDWSGLEVRKVVRGAQWIESIGPERKILVTDLPGLSPHTADTARKAGFKFLVHLCVDGADHYSADLFLNASPSPLPLIPAAMRMSSGLQFAIIRPEIRKCRPAASWGRGSIKRGLVAMGGSDSHNLAGTMAHYLQLLGISPTIVAGPAVSSDRLDKWRGEGFDVRSSPTGSELAGMMLQNDLVVTPGGVTSFEAMHLGTPVLCVDFGRQGWFCRNLASAGIATLINESALNNPTALDVSRLMKAAAEGFQIVDGRGATRALSTILEFGCE